MQKLIGAASTRSIDLPLLNVIGPLFATAASKCLRKMLATSISISINRSGYARYGHYLDELPFPALLCIFEIDELDGSGVAVLDGRMVETVVYCLLGGDMSREPEFESRSPTSMDKKLVWTVMEGLMEALSQSFFEANSAIGHLTIRPMRIETMPQFANISSERTNVFRLSTNIDVGEHGYQGTLDVVIPIPLLEPITNALKKTTAQSNTIGDRIWAERLAHHMANIPMVMEAVLERFDASAAELSRLDVGDVLRLSTTNDSPVELQILTGQGLETVAQGRLGILKRKKCIKLTEDPSPSFLDPLMQEIGDNIHDG